MAPAPAYSTPLENVRLGRDGADLEVEGKSIQLRGSAHDLAVGAFHVFYQCALADYRERLASIQQPSLFQRMRAWLARLLGVEPAPPATAPTQKGEVATAPTPDVSPEVPARPLPPVRSAVPAPRAPAAVSPRPTPESRNAPFLRSAYADGEGVHLIWQTGPNRRPEEQVQFICKFDSAVGHQLLECYGQLTKLGHKVVGLEFWPPAPEMAASPVGSPFPGPSPVLAELSAIPSKTLPDRDPLSAVAAEKKTPVMVMRLHSSAPDEPTRALVAPVDHAENLQVLVAPERIVRALYAGADPVRPAEQRVTYLRCGLSKSGLKLIDVGIGEGRHQSPARWEQAGVWWARMQKRPEAETKQAHPAPAPGPELSLM